MSGIIESNFLKSIKIKGFKSIKECNLELKNINVLIGSNGAGKSNFISIFNLFSHVLAQELSLYVGRRGINSLLYNGRKATDNISIEFYFDLSAYSFELEPTQDNRLIFKNERFGYNGNWDSSQSGSAGQQESKWKNGSGNENIDKYIISVLEKEESLWRVYHFHDTGLNSRIKTEHNLSNCKALQWDAHNLAAFLYRLKANYLSEYQNIIESVRLVAPYFKNFELEPNENNKEHIVLRWQQKGCEDIFNASQLSDGTLRFICLATLLLQPKELQPATMIVDEPELGLHPFAITVFSEMVKKAAVKKQIILSTQSVELLNQFNVDDVIVVDRSNNSSEFKRLNADELADWLENDYTLGDLWNKNILGGRVSK
jgi:predicted ATPase